VKELTPRFNQKSLSTHSVSITKGYFIDTLLSPSSLETSIPPHTETVRIWVNLRMDSGIRSNRRRRCDWRRHLESKIVGNSKAGVSD
jgi:hypothetical protein